MLNHCIEYAHSRFGYLNLFLLTSTLVLLFGCLSAPISHLNNSDQNFTQNQSTNYSQNPQVNPQTLVNINAIGSNSLKLGSDNSDLIMIEFTDYQCNFCRSFWQNQEKQLKTDYVDKGKLQIIYLNLPVTELHPAAEATALAVICAQQFGKGKEMQEKIFSEQAKYGSGFVGIYSEDIKNWSRSLGLNDSFDNCVIGQQAKDKLSSDKTTASNLNLTATPSFLIGRRDGKMGVVPIIGAQSYDIFNSTITVFLDQNLTLQ